MALTRAKDRSPARKLPALRASRADGVRSFARDLFLPGETRRSSPAFFSIPIPECLRRKAAGPLVHERRLPRSSSLSIRLAWYVLCDLPPSGPSRPSLALLIVPLSKATNNRVFPHKLRHSSKNCLRYAISRRRYVAEPSAIHVRNSARTDGLIAQRRTAPGDGWNSCDARKRCVSSPAQDSNDDDALDYRMADGFVT